MAEQLQQALDPGRKPSGVTLTLYRLLRLNTIRGQLTIGIIAALLPCFAIGFGVVRQLVKQQVLTFSESRLKAEAALIAYGLSEWGQSTRDTVKMLANVPALRDQKVDEIQHLFDDNDQLAHYRMWRLWTAGATPRLLAHSGKIDLANINVAQAHQASRDYHKKATRGESTYDVVFSRLTRKPCLIFAEPVYPQTRLMPEAQRRRSLKPNGVLSLCIPLEFLGEDTGIKKAFADNDLTFLRGKLNLDVDHGQKGHHIDSEVILVSNNGQMLFPSMNKNIPAIPTVEALRSSRWSGLYPIAKNIMNGKEEFATVGLDDQRFFVFTNRVDSTWSVVLVLNSDKAYAQLAEISRILLIFAIATIVAASLIIAQRCTSITKPVKVAGGALRSIGEGNFDTHVDVSRDDEMGDLLLNINKTAERLKGFVQQTTHYAVTEKQLQTAKRIQGDFLLNQLPHGDNFEIAAMFRPAYEIGADWYDVIDRDDYSVLVVADVCDKGVPSALYMSVFRSLIRSSFLGSSAAGRPDVQGQAFGDLLRECIESTNDYMALNHEQSMMFATLIAAAVDHRNNHLTYLSAGHEPGILLRDGEVILLDQTGGPAVGIFQGSRYSIASLDLKPGDYLMLFTDGAVDVRNPEGHDLGLKALIEIVKGAAPTSAEMLLETVLAVIDQHMSTADQFDDITIMVYHYIDQMKA